MWYRQTPPPPWLSRKLSEGVDRGFFGNHRELTVVSSEVTERCTGERLRRVSERIAADGRVIARDSFRFCRFERTWRFRIFKFERTWRFRNVPWEMLRLSRRVAGFPGVGRFGAAAGLTPARSLRGCSGPCAVLRNAQRISVWFFGTHGERGFLCGSSERIETAASCAALRNAQRMRPGRLVQHHRRREAHGSIGRWSLETAAIDNGLVSGGKP